MVQQIPGRSSLNGGLIGSAPAGLPGGRLTLTTLTPVLTATVSASATVLYTPYQVATLPIQVGTGLWGQYAFAELTNTLSDAATNPAAAVANANYDLFVWNNAGTITLSRGPFWSKTATVTTPVASPGVVNWTGHGLAAGTPVSFSGGVLPTGIVANTVYFVIAAGLAANAFEISATVGGSAINFTGSSSGTQTGVGGNDTARGTGAGTTQLTLQNGILVNTVAITNGPGAGLGTYVGTIRTNATATADMNFGAAGTAALINVWNAYNRDQVVPYAADSTVSWTYTTATVRGANGADTTRISFIRGLNEDWVTATYQCEVTTTANAGSLFSSHVGLDSNTVQATRSSRGFIQDAAAAASGSTLIATFADIPGLGFHYLEGLETGDGTHANTVFAGGSYQGLTAVLRA